MTEGPTPADRPPGRRRPWLTVAFLAVVLAAVVTARPAPADPSARLPKRYRLADLIVAQQRTTAELRAEVERLRDELDAEREARAAGSVAAPTREAVEQLSTAAGFIAMRGPGLRVTLDDALTADAPKDANVNDLVIHSRDVQAAVNALWRSGAEAISINGQRLVGTSAVLCVGNTLLLNGTVHSPPYVMSAIGAVKDRFDGDPLVKRLKDAEKAFGIKVQVEKVGELDVPAFGGAAKLSYARPVA